jgi:hypothetical protein
MGDHFKDYVCEDCAVCPAFLVALVSCKVVTALWSSPHGKELRASEDLGTSGN